MNSSAEAFDDRQDQEILDLKDRYTERVAGSKLGKAEKEACLKWIREGQGVKGGDITAKDVRTALEFFGQNEQASERQVAQYKLKIKTFAERGLFSKNRRRQKAYLDWFEELPYEDSRAPMDKKRALLKSDLDRKERYTMLEQWKMLPSAVRKKLQATYDDNDLEDNLAMLEKLLKRHEDLKTRFLRLPEKAQDELRTQFQKIGDFDEREAFLEEQEKERLQLTDEYRRKIYGMQQPDENGLTLFSDTPQHRSDSSAAKYVEWFSNLGSRQMKKMLASSALDDKQRITYRDQISGILAMMPAEKAAEVRQKFNASDITGRRRILAQYGQGQTVEEKTGTENKQVKNFVQQVVREEALSNSHQKVRHAMETEAILTEATKERRRGELMYHAYTVEGLQNAAASKDRVDAIKESQDIAETTENTTHTGQSATTEKNDEFTLKRETLGYDQELRARLKRRFRSRVEDQNAILTNVHFVRNAGGEMQTEEFRRTELQAAREDVRAAILPILKLRSAQEGLVVNSTILEKELENADFGHIGKEILKKAA